MACKAMLAAVLGAGRWTRFRAGKLVVNPLPVNETLRAEGPLQQKCKILVAYPATKNPAIRAFSAPVAPCRSYGCPLGELTQLYRRTLAANGHASPAQKCG